MTQTSSRWYVELLKRFTDISTRLQLNEKTREELKEFVLAIAKEQYMTGNRCGIRWMREQTNKQVVAA